MNITVEHLHYANRPIEEWVSSDRRLDRNRLIVDGYSDVRNVYVFFARATSSLLEARFYRKFYKCKLQPKQTIRT